MKDLGFPHLFLGIQITKCSEGLFLSQSHYAEQLIEKASLTNCKPCSTPIVCHDAPPPMDTPFPDVTLYRSLAGSLLYLTLTRPDISFAVNWVCQFMHTPLHSHFVALKRILRYLHGCLHEGLLMQPGSLTITGFADSDWAGDKTDRKSTTGFCVFLGDNMISWCAKKQPTIARSSTEAEYKALATAAADVLWLLQLLRDMHLTVSSTPLLWCDNMGAIALASNSVFHARTKHVEVDYHFIREKIQLNLLSVAYIPSSQQLADIFTKALHSPQFLVLKAQLPLISFTPRCFPGGHHLPGGCEVSEYANVAGNSAVDVTAAVAEKNELISYGAKHSSAEAKTDANVNVTEVVETEVNESKANELGQLSDPSAAAEPVNYNPCAAELFGPCAATESHLAHGSSAAKLSYKEALELRSSPAAKEVE